MCSFDDDEDDDDDDKKPHIQNGEIQSPVAGDAAIAVPTQSGSTR